MVRWLSTHSATRAARPQAHNRRRGCCPTTAPGCGAPLFDMRAPGAPLQQLLARVTRSCPFPCTLLYSMQVTLMSEPTERGVAVQAQIELVC